MTRACCWSQLLILIAIVARPLAAAEQVWLEAEHLDGIRGFCWPMGDDARKMRETAGHWALSGPGWAAEWNQGGESGFLSIATGAADDKAEAAKTIEVPAAGKYFVWVRYGDWREQTERFQIRLDQMGAQPWSGQFGERPMVEEDNEAKLYWGWAFVWDRREVVLSKGPLKVSLLSTTKDPQPRQIDVIVLSTDPDYRPRIKDRPSNPAWQVLESYRDGFPAKLEPLARKQAPPALPDCWKTRTFNDKGFLYLWNVKTDGATGDWLTDDPNRVLFPYNVGDEKTIAAFKQKYGGKQDVPIFSDPRTVPTFHGVGPIIFKTDAQGEVIPEGQKFAAWLDTHPDRHWGTMMNYAPEVPIGDKGVALFQKYRNRYVGAIAGESLGYFYVDPPVMQAQTATAQTRRQVAEVMTRLFMDHNKEKYRKVYGKDLDANAYQDVISCLSVGNIVFAPFCSLWGARTIGYESSAICSNVLSMRWAFIRGIARQGNHLSATYRSCNFGDSCTIFSNVGSYHTPQNLFDNYYSVFSGAGMTWYKFDIWYQYMAGSSMFYHEQGFDEFWQPGGLTAAGLKEVQLSPKGKLVDRFLRATAQEPDRGSPFTPIAFLVDYAHGWEPAPYWPNSFKNFHSNEQRFRYGDHEKMLEEYFWTAYYPIGPESEKPVTGTNEVYLPGVFGDIFDVIYAFPQVERWTTIDTYPVVIANGEIELTAAEGKRLADYVNAGGTLVVADAHLTGPGLAELKLPTTGPAAEAEAVRWMDDKTDQACGRFRYKPIIADGGRALATTPDGKTICAAFDRGQGRLIYLAVPHGLTIGKQALPVLPRLIAHLSRGQMPVEVAGRVQWLVNRTSTGWAVTLLNPAGQLKYQQGIAPTDYRENRAVTIKLHVPVKAAFDRLLPTDKFAVENNEIKVEVPAGGVRIIDLR